MALSTAEQKARREVGRMRAMREMTLVEKIHRALVNGRPRVELRTPLAAITEAKTLYRELESRMTAEGLKPKAGDWAVSIGYVTADLSVVGFSPLFTAGQEAALERYLAGHIMLGLVFGMVDKTAKDAEDRIIMGTRPFLTTKQAEAWLSELVAPVRLEMED